MTREKRRIYNKNYEVANRARIREYQKSYRAANAERIAKISRASDLKRHYGMSLEDYAALFDKQDGACAICKRDGANFKQTLHVDHDHSNGRVRGLLCPRCNAMLGWLETHGAAANDYLLSSLSAHLEETDFVKNAICVG